MESGNDDVLRKAMTSHRRIVLITDGYSTPFVAKTAISILRYRTDDVVAVIDQEASGTTAQQLLLAGGDIPVVGSLSAVNDADALYVGIAPPGGKLPDEWRPLILEALRRKMDVVSGLHDFLIDDEEYVAAAKQSGARLIDVRRNRHKSTAKRHRFRPGNVRIHAVGHDCSVGKMVVTLEIQRGLAAAGHDAKFLATGQTGIMISGEGVPIDCVVADFVNGAAEELVKANEQHDFLLIEGQGSISHPSFSAVTLGLLHGCAPDGLVFCYEAGRDQVKGLDNVDIPDLADQIQAYEAVANLRHPCKMIGIAVNTRNLTAEEADAELFRAEDRFGLPACDVYRTGADKLVQASIALREEVFAR
ncbi:DUF1611 domain-containing protein [Fuerstiella marisgermanici]|uniref:DUF1611 domain-containing protein n=1 Tax=Fuerstiella marisgermanici TaxID=1891926 RepID=A0A1P8WFS1_9PLAN|nr:DUF1611 domain-containing protein [Fuerstiella marisgermanici]APZ92908.1 hypothetical protein Fuma_02520 [Fuerstiella marisgermanici]